MIDVKRWSYVAVVGAVLTACKYEDQVGHRATATGTADAGTLDTVEAAAAWSGDRTIAVLVDSDELILSAGSRVEWRATAGAPISREAMVDTAAAVQDSGNVYAAYRAPNNLRGIVAVDKSTTDAWLMTSGWDDVNQLALDHGWVYFDLVTAHGAGELHRASTTTGDSELVMAGLSAPDGLAVDGTYVFVADRGAGQVIAVPQGGGSPIVLASALNRPADLLVVGDWLYVTERGVGTTDGRICRVQRPTSSMPMPMPFEVVASGLDAPTRLAADATSIYWWSPAIGVQRTSLSPGGSVEMLMSTGWQYVNYPFAIAVRDGHYDVVWRNPEVPTFPIVFDMPK
jgi:hypothetical protein